MGLQKILYDHIKTYSITENNVIGTTTSLTLRTLENASPNDTNSIWLAPNGSDIAAGTEAAPVLTIEKAIDLLVVGYPTTTTIHIFRNSYVGDLEFTTTNAKTLPGGSIIQVELGEIATILFQEGVWTWPYGNLNGIEIKDQGVQATLINMEVSSNVNHNIKWCDFVSDTSSSNTQFISLGRLGISSGNSPNPTIQNSIFQGAKLDYLIGGGNQFDLTMDDCILIGDGDIIGINQESANPTFVNIEHSTFIDLNYMISGGIVTVADIKNCIFSNINYIAAVSDLNAPLHTLTNNLYTNDPRYIIIATGATGNATSTNSITGVDPLFFDDDNYDLRLMDQRRTAPDSDQPFVITSKAVENTGIGQTPSDDSRDLGPYDLTYTPLLNTWQTLEFDNEAWNEALDVPFELINYQNFNDIRGNFHRAFDGEWGKRTMLLKRTPNTYCGTDESADLLDVFQSDSSKRFYPFGDDGIFQSSGTLTLRDDGDYDVSLDSIAYLKRKFYRGFICSTSSGAVDYDLQIRDNTSGALVLHDHRGNQSGVTASDYLITCLYLPVEIDMSTMQLQFMNWDPQTNPWNPDFDPTSIEGYEQVDITEPQSWEANIHELILKETEDDE